LHPKVAGEALRIVCKVARELLRYDFSQIDEDFFKEIYQEIVERGERHRIGEYYTPEWLAQLILREAMGLWRERNQGFPRILDPACGSGTFLCNAIHIAREELENKGEPLGQILDFIVNNVVGVDVNPLAAIVARANYLIALGDLTQLGKPIVIPVYVADSMRIPRVLTTLVRGGSVTVYEVDADGHPIQIPKSVIARKAVLRQIFEAFKDATSAYKARANRDEALKIFEKEVSAQLSSDEFEVLKLTLNTILALMDKGLDSIWIFMLKNVYAPMVLMESKFDMIVGNPPWIAMRYIENESYQDFLKQQVLTYGLLERKQVHLFASMEAATLFFCRSSDLYLKDNGLIAFVMPRSVLTGALHHASFKRLRNPKMELIKIFDFEYVSPLFNVPSCALIAIKGGETRYPVPMRKYAGKLPEKNISIVEAIKHFKAEDREYKPPPIPTGYSEYYHKVREGATIIPRGLWFVEFDVHPTFGMDSSRPLVKSASDVLKGAKVPWRDIELRGNVEAGFVYVTLLGGDVVPFGYRKLRPVVLPLESSPVGYRLLDVDALRNKGLPLMAEWLEEAQRIWESKATGKSRRNFPRIVSRLDHMGELSGQKPRVRYITLYNRSGTNIASCVIDKFELPSIEIGKIAIKPAGFVVEHMCFFYETGDEGEAHYLSAVLNSDVVNEAIKPLQPRGLFGERHIHRRPFMLQIPRFEKNDPIHTKLAELSKQCHAKITSLECREEWTAGLRKEAREAVNREIAEINRLVSQLFAALSGSHDR